MTQISATISLEWTINVLLYTRPSTLLPAPLLLTSINDHTFSDVKFSTTLWKWVFENKCNLLRIKGVNEIWVKDEKSSHVCNRGLKGKATYCLVFYLTFTTNLCYPGIAAGVTCYYCRLSVIDGRCFTPHILLFPITGFLLHCVSAITNKPFSRSRIPSTVFVPGIPSPI